MSSTSRAWVVAASMGVVEALKDQGFCRWNATFRSLHQHARANLGAVSRAKRLSCAAVGRSEEVNEQARLSESLRKVIYLSCWGPN